MTARHATRRQQEQTGTARRITRRTTVTAAAAAAVLAIGAPAWAFWTADAATTATADATTLQPPATVEGVGTSALAVSLTVTGAGTGPTPTGYRVSRGATVVCPEVALNEACTETGLEPETGYEYSVVSLLGQWVSAPAVVTATTLQAPTVPSVPQLTTASDSGAKGDGFTNDTAPAFTGTARPGSVITLLVDGDTVTPTATADQNGSWTLQPAPAPSANATHTVAARATLNGLTSPASGTSTLLIDTVAPTTGATITACSGAVTLTFCRGNLRITVNGIADAAPSSGRDVVGYSVTGGVTGTVPVGTNGSAVILYSAPDGQPPVTFRAVDVAGNQSAPVTVTGARTLDNTVLTVAGVSLVNGGQAGRADAGDRVQISFADQTSGVNPQGFCSNWGPTDTARTIGAGGGPSVTITNAGSNDVLSVTTTACGGNFTLGSVALGANYVNTTTTFGGVTSNSISWSGQNANRVGTLTVTLGTGASPVTGVLPATPVYTPTTSVRDIAGNRLPATPVTTVGTSRF